MTLTEQLTYSLYIAECEKSLEAAKTEPVPVEPEVVVPPVPPAPSFTPFTADDPYCHIPQWRNPDPCGLVQ